MSKITGVKKYGKIPMPNESESHIPPFRTVHVDMIRSWSVKISMLGKIVSKEIDALTIVDRATTWPEIVAVPSKKSLIINKLFEHGSTVTLDQSE